MYMIVDAETYLSAETTVLLERATGVSNEDIATAAVSRAKVHSHDARQAARCFRRRRRGTPSLLSMWLDAEAPARDSKTLSLAVARYARGQLRSMDEVALERSAADAL